MLRLAGLAAIAIAGTPAAHAAEWRLAAASDRAVSYLDTAAIAKTDGVVRFQRWMFLARPLASGADSIRDGFEATCATRAYRVTSAEAFAGARDAGRLPAASGTADPDSVTASLIAIACGERPPVGATVADPALDAKARLQAAPAG